MSQKNDDIFVQDTDNAAGGSELFGSKVSLTPTEKELFTGEFSFLRDLPIKPETHTRKTGFGSSSQSLYAILGVNLVVTCVLVGVVWLKPVPVISSAQSVPSPASNPPSAGPKPEETGHGPTVQVIEPRPDKEEVSPIKETAAGISEGVSLKAGDDFYAQGDYSRAISVYTSLISNLGVSGPEAEYLKDYLGLRVALCHLRADMNVVPESYFTEALQSRCGLIRGLAGYYLALAYYQQGNYLVARKMAYQALGVYETFKDRISSTLESDLYFLAAESLSRHVLKLHSEDVELPGRLWSDSLEDILPRNMDQTELGRLLVSSAGALASGATGPDLRVDINRPVGNQWSLVCLKNPVEEVLIRASSQSGTGLIWKTIDTTLRNMPVTMCVQFAPQQYAIEVAVGSTGLLWKYDGQSGLVLNPDEYNDLIRYRSDLIEEAVSIWQRFLIRYRGDHRVANAHYLLGRIYAMDQQHAEGLAEFKLIQGYYVHNPLAPYAFLESGKIKIQMKDYQGARADLNEMRTQFPDSKIADSVTLVLAQAMLDGGQPDAAEEMFGRVYHMTLNRRVKLDATIGLGQAAFHRKDWVGTRKWLGESLELLEDKTDIRIVSVCSMFGRACIELGEYKQAAVALRLALVGKANNHDYVQIVIDLAEAEQRLGNYISAINILEGVPQDRLNQEDSCQLLIAKTRILREIDAPESAISQLRKRIEYISDSHLRALLTLELARCHYDQEDYNLARRELNEVIADMQETERILQAKLLLAQIADKLDQPDQVEVFCYAIVSTPDADAGIRDAAFRLLGRIYTAQKQYEKAAMAFAGIWPKGTNL